MKGHPVRYRRGHAPRKINHALADVDGEKRTATCSRCGPVSIKRNAGGWRCCRRVVKRHTLGSVDVQTETGYCRGCAKVVPVTYRANKGWVCAPSYASRDLAYRTTHHEQVEATTAAWRDRNDLRLRERHLAKKYGLTVDQYEAMLAEQGGVCAVCRRPPRPEHRGGLLHVDHCHETGVNRGLLCQDCNTALGLLHDDVEALRQAIEYLTLHGAPPLVV